MECIGHKTYGAIKKALPLCFTGLFITTIIRIPAGFHTADLIVSTEDIAVVISCSLSV